MALSMVNFYKFPLETWKYILCFNNKDILVYYIIY